MSIFEQAAREKFRFPSSKGQLTTENLWDLSLTSKVGFDLDSVAKAVNSELKSVTEESFVSTTTNPAKSALEAKLEIVKHIIAVKLRENEELRNAAFRKAEKQRLMEILERKEVASLEGLTEAEIRAKIAAL